MLHASDRLHLVLRTRHRYRSGSGLPAIRTRHRETSHAGERLGTPRRGKLQRAHTHSTAGSMCHTPSLVQGIVVFCVSTCWCGTEWFVCLLRMSECLPTYTLRRSQRRPQPLACVPFSGFGTPAGMVLRRLVHEMKKHDAYACPQSGIEPWRNNLARVAGLSDHGCLGRLPDHDSSSRSRIGSEEGLQAPAPILLFPWHGSRFSRYATLESSRHDDPRPRWRSTTWTGLPASLGIFIGPCLSTRPQDGRNVYSTFHRNLRTRSSLLPLNLETLSEGSTE